jgi:hypothetical protein
MTIPMPAAAAPMETQAKIIQSMHLAFSGSARGPLPPCNTSRNSTRRRRFLLGDPAEAK